MNCKNQTNYAKFNHAGFYKIQRIRGMMVKRANRISFSTIIFVRP